MGFSRINPLLSCRPFPSSGYSRPRGFLLQQNRSVPVFVGVMPGFFSDLSPTGTFTWTLIRMGAKKYKQLQFYPLHTIVSIVPRNTLSSLGFSALARDAAEKLQTRVTKERSLPDVSKCGVSSNHLTTTDSLFDQPHRFPHEGGEIGRLPGSYQIAVNHHFAVLIECSGPFHLV